MSYILPHIPSSLLQIFFPNMKFFIIIVLIHCMYSFGDKVGARITKNQLRGMHKETYEGLLKDLFIKTFDSIYDAIIEHAKLGQNEYRFTIMCEEIPNNKCDTQNKYGNQQWPQTFAYYPVSRETPYIITTEQYTENVVNALKQTFPDSNFTKINKNCCDYHTIKW